LLALILELAGALLEPLLQLLQLLLLGLLRAGQRAMDCFSNTWTAESNCCFSFCASS